MDCVPLTNPNIQHGEPKHRNVGHRSASRSNNNSRDSSEPNDHDDFAGVIINASKSINFRELILIWLWFLVIHSESFVSQSLSRISNAVDSDGVMTMTGTLYASIIMIVGVLLIDMIYR